MQKITKIFDVDPDPPCYNAVDMLYILSSVLECKTEDLVKIHGKSVPVDNPEIFFDIIDYKPEGAPFSAGKKLQITYNDTEYVESFPVHVTNYMLYLIAEQLGEEYVPADIILEEHKEFAAQKPLSINELVKEIFKKEPPQTDEDDKS